jgi:hypothetical protein
MENSAAMTLWDRVDARQPKPALAISVLLTGDSVFSASVAQMRDAFWRRANA